MKRISLIVLVLSSLASACDASHADIRRTACSAAARVCDAVNAACTSGGDDR